MTSFATKEELVAYRDKVWAEHMYVAGGFRFLWVTGQVWVREEEKPRLTETEADVLHALIKAWPRPLTSRKLLDALSVFTTTTSNQLKVYIRRIRLKVGIPEIILTYPGRGYTFNPEVLL